MASSYPLGNTSGCTSVGLRRDGSLPCDLQSTELSDHVCAGKTTELVFVSWSKVPRQKTRKKIILQQTQTGIKYFPLFSKQKRIGTCGWGSSSSREMLAETTTSEKGKHWESCGQGRYRHRWQLNTALPHTIASQNHNVRNKPCPQLLKYHISHPRGCRKARFALQCPH